jgi:multiple sugar transport system ATP-binding protein
MGRAMVREAAVFLFDEPLSNLDAKLRAHMRTEIRQLHNRLKTTTIYVTHDQIEAMTMADRIVVMRAGKIEQIGTPDDVYDRPASKYVADFIGSSAINFLPGSVVSGDGVPVVDTATGRVPLEAGSGVKNGQKVVIGLRPTDLVVDDTGPLSATTVLLERLGHDAQLFCKGADGSFVAIVDKSARYAEGDNVRFSIPPSKVHVFDAQTEIRV